MQTKIFHKFDFVAFIANILAVILGIVITFSIQGVIDKRNEKENVRSALQLVENELKDCRDVLQYHIEKIGLESKAAGYILSHSDNLFDCPEDSLLYCYNEMVSLCYDTTTSDALDLLKTSSLFQAIGNNDLSVKILRAYNYCQSLRPILSEYLSIKIDIFNILIKNWVMEGGKDNKCYYLDKLCGDTVGLTFLARLRSHNLRIYTKGISVLDRTIDAIEEYLAD